MNKKQNTSKHLKLDIRSKKQLLFVVTIFIVSAASALVAVTISDTSKQVDSTTNAPTKVLSSQQVANSSAYTVSINSVSESTKRDPAFTLPENEVILIVDVSITNNTNQKQELIPVTQFYVRSSEGSTYNMHPSIFVTKPLQAEQINPHQTVTGQVSFAVPKNLERPLMHVDLGWDNYVPVVYDVLH